MCDYILLLPNKKDLYNIYITIFNELDQFDRFLVFSG